MSGRIIEEVKCGFNRFLQSIANTSKEEFLEFDMTVKDHCLDEFYFKYLEKVSLLLKLAEALK